MENKIATQKNKLETLKNPTGRLSEVKTTKKEELLKRIQDYLETGGMWNPELAIHDNVRDLIIDLREELKFQK